MRWAIQPLKAVDVVHNINQKRKKNHLNFSVYVENHLVKFSNHLFKEKEKPNKSFLGNENKCDQKAGRDDQQIISRTVVCKATHQPPRPVIIWNSLTVSSGRRDACERELSPEPDRCVSHHIVEVTAAVRWANNRLLCVLIEFIFEPHWCGSVGEASDSCCQLRS